MLRFVGEQKEKRRFMQRSMRALSPKAMATYEAGNASRSKRNESKQEHNRILEIKRRVAMSRLLIHCNGECTVHNQWRLHK